MGRDSKTNGSGSGSGGGCGSGGGQIPASMKKVVQNLKEIVNNNCMDTEIYAVLKECNMDPNDAVQRLLSQDTFHEVRSRRERRKEMKETQEVKSQANNGTSNHSVRGSSEHSFGRTVSIQMSSKELGKAAYRKENGSIASIPHSASTLHAAGQTRNEQSSPHCNSVNIDNGCQSVGTCDMIDLPLESSLGSQSSRMGTSSGHVTMADIVRMGRPQSKGSQMPYEISYSPQDAVPPNSAIYQMKPALATSHSQLGAHQDLHSSDMHVTGKSGKKSSQHEFGDEWPQNEILKSSSDSGFAIYPNQSYSNGNRGSLSSNFWSDDILVSESNAVKTNLSSDHVNTAYTSNKNIFISDLGGTSQHDHDACKDLDSPNFFREIYEPQEVPEMIKDSKLSIQNHAAALYDDAIKAVSSAAMNLQELSLGKDTATAPKEDNCGVVLPDYLQAFSADCSHLSFGTYKSGKRKVFSGPQASSSLTNGSEKTSTTSSGHPSSTHINSRNLVYQDGEQLIFDFDAHREIVDVRNYNSPNFSQAELRKLDILDAAAYGNDFVAHSFTPSSSFKDIHQSSSLSFVVDPNARNLSPLPSKVNLNCAPSDILGATVQSIKAKDSAAFLASQPNSLRYSSSSMKYPTASASKAASAGAFSASHSLTQALLAANLTTEPGLKEHLSAHDYSQSGYPAITQGGRHASTLQQAYQDGNMFHESDIGLKYSLSQYGSASMSSLPLSGLQNLGNSADFPGKFPHNLSGSPAGPNVGYDDFFYPQYRNRGADLNLLQQNEGSNTRDYVYGSRTMATISGSAYYNLLGQNYQLAGYPLLQQESQPYGAFGYPGVYGSRAGITTDQLQQQNLRDVILNGPQSPSSKQLPQIWQRSY